MAQINETKASDEPGKRHAGVRQVWRESPLAVKSLLFGTMINRLGGFVQVFMVLYLTHRGFSDTQAGAALGVYGAGAVLGTLVGGWMSDRLGPRLTIVSTLLGSAVLLPCVLYLDNYWAILAVITVSGAASLAYQPASTSMISLLTPPERHVMIFSMSRLAINLGTTAAPLLGAALVKVSWDFLFWGEALAVVVFSAVTATTLPRREPATAGPKADSEDGPNASYLAVLSDRRYLMFLLAMFVSSVIYIQHISALPLAVKHLGMDVEVYAAMIALNGLLVIACELLVAKVVQHWQLRTAVIIGVLLTGVGMAMYALPWGLAALVIATLVWSLGEIIGYPSLFFAYPAQAGPPGLRGRYLGASNALYGLGSAVGPFIGVMIWNRYQQGLWVLCGVVGLVAAAAAWAGVRPRAETDGDKRDGGGPATGTAGQNKGIGDTGTAGTEIRTAT
ncbi:MDR family MFS transporter [Streptomyces sp. NPDC004041]|uniref:MDR family MFS transporter n=1 Tax=Streptomyces sp. NPDC004041 TaxID=3364688 RepID=UPI0036B3889A